MTPVLPMVLLIVSWNAAMVALFFFYRKDMLKSPGAKFVFGISDLWALILGLTPFLMLVAYLIETHNYEMLTVVLSVGVPHGLAGTYLATLYNSFMQHDTERSQWAAFFSTVAGAFLGTTLFAVVSFLLLVLVGTFLGLFISTFPVSVVLLVATVVLWKLSRPSPKATPGGTNDAPNNAETPNDRSRDA